jgi:di/tripeptidase
VWNLHRELGIFEKKKEYTDEYVKRYGGMGDISMEEKTSYPAYSSPSNDQVVNMVQENEIAK